MNILSIALLIVAGVMLYRVVRKRVSRNATKPAVSSSSNFDTHRDPGDEADHFI